MNYIIRLVDMKSSIGGVLLIASLVTFVAGDICAGGCECSERIMDCSNRSLSHIPEIPEEFIVDALNLSHNNIEKVDVEDFKRYESLVSLDISFNLISYIQDGSFSSMKHLKILKMSHCLLRLPSDDVFSDNNALEELYLDHNNLESIPKLPVSVKHLDLKDAQISQISPLNLPLLNYLDISHNKLKDISLQTRNSLSNVATLIIYPNPWKCSNMFPKLMCWIYFRSEMIPEIIKCSSTTGRKQTYRIFKQHVMCEKLMDTAKDTGKPFGKMTTDESDIQSVHQKLIKGKNDQSWQNFNVSPLITRVLKEEDITDSKASQNNQQGIKYQKEQPRTDDSRDSADNTQLAIFILFITLFQTLLIVCTIFAVAYVAKTFCGVNLVLRRRNNQVEDED